MSSQTNLGSLTRPEIVIMLLSFFIFFILFSFYSEQRRYAWYDLCVKELLAPLVWHSLCLTYDHTSSERSVFIDNQLILQDKLRNN